MEGYNVITAESGETAIDIVCSKRERVDLILMDIDLGSGMDGTETAQEILKEHNVPVLFLSSHTEKEIVEKTEKITSYGYVVKNTGITVLYASIKMAFKLFEAKIKEKEKNEALRESEARFDRLAEQSRTITWEVDTNGLFTYVNHVAEQIIGYRPDELIGKKHYYDICPEEGREALKTGMMAAFERREGFSGLENAIQTKEGRVVWVSANGFPVFYADGTIRGYCGSDTDITERKIVERELVRAKKQAEADSRAKNTFLANMSHELRTPMSVIIGFTSLMEMSGLNDEQNEFNAAVKDSSAKLLEIINAMLDLSMLDADKIKLEIKPFDICATLDNSRTMIARLIKNKELTLKNEIDPEIGFMVLGDQTRFKQILLNLLSNAVKFTPSGTISTKLWIVSKESEKTRIAISVSDEGIGIPVDKFDEIFEMFHQLDESMTKLYKGTGLGLSIAKGFVELMGGTIRVESQLGKGSCFTIEIPFEICSARVEQVNDKRLLPEESKLKRPYNILLCEDDEVSCSLIIVMAKKFNWNVKVANNGKDAFDIYLKHKFDAIIMDGQMPEMNGFEATRKIRDVEKFSSEHIPIIALTAFTKPENRAEFIDVGMDDYIPKPLTNINLLHETILKHLK